MTGAFCAFEQTYSGARENESIWPYWLPPTLVTTPNSVTTRLASLADAAAPDCVESDSLRTTCDSQPMSAARRTNGAAFEMAGFMGDPFLVLIGVSIGGTDRKLPPPEGHAQKARHDLDRKWVPHPARSAR